MSEDLIASECNKLYFQLCFLLKQNQLKKFEFDLEILIRKYKRFYGDYWKNAMKKECGRYLKEIAENRKYYKTVEFIFHKCPFIEFNSNILTEFEEIKDLIFVFGDNIKKEDQEFLDNWRNIIKDFSPPEDQIEENEFGAIFRQSFEVNDVTKKRLFGRITEEDTSLLEEMLVCPYSNFIFKCAWNDFRLWTKPEIFTYKNPSGKTLFDYALESGDEEQFLFLLMPNSVKEVSFDKNKHFMVMKNNQLYSKTGKCIVEHLLENLVDTGNGSLFRHFIYLLEEIGVVKELMEDSLVDKLINLAKSENFFEQITGLLPYDNVEMARQLFHIEDILGNMIVYWSIDSEIYIKYKNELENVSSFYKLIFLIIEHKDKQFCRDFQAIMTNLEESFDTRYKDPEESERYSSNMLFIMLLAAIRTKQRRIIDFIFNNDTFFTIYFEFPENIVPGEIHYYTALKFLKYKHGIGHSKIPKDWLTCEVLEDFFDSQITFNNQELIEIDCYSLIHTQSQKKVFNVQSNITDKDIMRDDMESLEYIMSQENLKELITHPVIETYINLKSLKYQRIFTWNFWAFVIFFIFPFILLILNNDALFSVPSDGSDNKNSDKMCIDLNIQDLQKLSSVCVSYDKENFKNIKNICVNLQNTTIKSEESTTLKAVAENLSIENVTMTPDNSTLVNVMTTGFNYHLNNLKDSLRSVAKYLHIIGIIFLFVRESFQCALSSSWTFYFKKYSNMYEMALFSLSIALSYYSLLDQDFKLTIKVLEVGFILLTTISATSILPFAHVPNNMQILKKVALTFLRIFYTFAIILIAFSFSFCIMFQDYEGEDAIENFKVPHTALVKIITMLSGEYEIQPAGLGSMQLLFFSIFIISSFILFNLILGLSIEDVQELKKSSRAFDLMTKSERFVEVSKKVDAYHRKHYSHHMQKKQENREHFLRELSFKIIRFFLSEYIYLHNITKIMVDIKTKQVFVRDVHKHQSVLKKVGRLTKDQNYYIGKETFKDIQSIINVKNKKMFKHLKKKIEQEHVDWKSN